MYKIIFFNSPLIVSSKTYLVTFKASMAWPMALTYSQSNDYSISCTKKLILAVFKGFTTVDWHTDMQITTLIATFKILKDLARKRCKRYQMPFVPWVETMVNGMLYSWTCHLLNPNLTPGLRILRHHWGTPKFTAIKDNIEIIFILCSYSQARISAF